MNSLTKKIPILYGINWTSCLRKAKRTYQMYQVLLLLNGGITVISGIKLLTLITL